MSTQKDINMVNRISDEKTIKSDLNDTAIPGVIYWRGIFIKEFSKEQLIKIIYLLMEND